MRLRVCFSRGEEARYISHLDLVRAVQRALRRSRLPIRYSEGFNPHPVLAFALALPVGLIADEDWFDIALEGDVTVEEAARALVPQMPRGLAVRCIQAVEDDAPALMPMVSGADYIATFERPQDMAVLKEEIARMMAAEEYLIQKRTKRGMKPTNIRPLVFDAKWQGEDRLYLSLAAGNNGGLNPRVLLEALCGGQVPSLYRLRLTRLHGMPPVEDGGV
nr:TIGR03936 family radical SAM-associated protein [bacterium]